MQYSRQQDQLMVYTQFEGLFSKDLQLSQEVSVVDEEHMVMNIHDKEIHYFFEKEHIIRKTETLDTFKLKVVRIDFKDEQKIDEKYQYLKLKTELLGASFEVFESKEISLAKRMNDYLLNEH